MSNATLAPFLKWPGGKRWFVANHANILPTRFRCYIEPFLGGGSVYFHLQPQHAILGDANEDLITTYRALRHNWQRLATLLQKHQANHSRRHYYIVRASRPLTPAAKAARLIYLNRTSFNGIYRVNRLGQFNVPKGDRSSVLLPSDDLRRTSALLRQAELRVADFEATLSEARRGDLVFADPPYTVRHDNNGFRKYNEVLFSWDDQLRLAAALGRARDRGAIVVSTNANHHSVRTIYQKYGFRLATISRFSSISGDPGSRRPLRELVIQSQEQ